MKPKKIKMSTHLIESIKGVLLLACEEEANFEERQLIKSIKEEFNEVTKED